jgi:hypothetical protein
VKLKTWGITVMTPHGLFPELPRHVRQCRAIVAAPSKAAAVRALNAADLAVTMHTFNGYAAETGNDTEIATATAHPLHVFVSPDLARVGQFVDLTAAVPDA